MIVVMNSPRYAGTTYMHSLGYSIAFCPYVDNDDERFAQIIHHEAVGHGFGYLGDEYDDVYDGEIPPNVMAELKEIADRYGWYSNIDFTPDITKVKWNYLSLTNVMLMKDWEHGKEHTDTGQVSGVRRISVSCSIMSAVLMLLAGRLFIVVS